MKIEFSIKTLILFVKEYFIENSKWNLKENHQTIFGTITYNLAYSNKH